MRQPVNDVVDAQFVRFVGVGDRSEASIRKLPVFRNVVVVIRDGQKALGRIVLFEHAVEDRTVALVVRRQKVERCGDLEEAVKNGCVPSSSTHRPPGITWPICAAKYPQPPRFSAKSSKITNPPFSR